ncbi:MAG: cell division ATP-binding protein FtsE [Bacteroidetes bacterium]|nr:cell division ATP-binding protein FtsE [Bacteroidota bacterium]
MPESIITLKNVSLNYDHRSILIDANFELKQQEFAYLIGPTGVGKSSILKLLYKDVEAQAGEITVNGFDLSALKAKQIPKLRRSMGIVFQDFQLLRDRNIFDNVAFSLHVTGFPTSQIPKKVNEVLSLVGLSHRFKQMPDDLSGGEQQRVVIARALVNEPRLLLADEPTGNLDPEASKEIMELLLTINKRGTAVLMVTHDHGLVKRYPHRTVLLKEGKIKDIAVS